MAQEIEIREDVTIKLNDAANILFRDESFTVKFEAVTGAGSGSGISEVSEDSTPQLGGDLDANGNDICIDSDNILYLDTDKNSYIFYNSTTGRIEVYRDGSKRAAF